MNGVVTVRVRQVLTSTLAWFAYAACAILWGHRLPNRSLAECEGGLSLDRKRRGLRYACART